MSNNLEEYYRHKTVLITGATGFVGKAILWQLMKVAGNALDKVYVLIRPKRIPAGSPSQRIIDEIINTPAFSKLPSYLQCDKEVFRRKLIPISYDLSLSHMGLSMEDSVQMRDTNIVIHCASTSEYESSLEWNLETNVLGTIRLMDYLDSCYNVCSFVHMSPIHIYQDAQDSSNTTILEYIYDTELGDPEEFLKQLLAADEKELSILVKRILQKFSTLHLFTKALVEHLIVRRMEQMRDEEKQGGKEPYALAIFRSHYIGPAMKDPVPGWTTGMSGASSWLALYGHSIPVVQPDQGSRPASILPVDYVAQSIVSSVPLLVYPGPHFALPLAQHVNNNNEQPIFPYIYNMTMPTIANITWHEAYSAIRDYWSRPSNRLSDHINPLPAADAYFSSNKTLSKARFLMQYYFRSSQPNPANRPSSSMLQSKAEGGQDQQKWMELASNIRNNLAKQNRHQWHYDSTQFLALIASLDMDTEIDPYNYFMQSCYGVHIYTMHGSNYLRTSVVPPHQLCALYSSKVVPSIMDSPLKSVVYTEDEMRQRIQHMIEIIIVSLKDPSGALLTEKEWKPLWIEYLNDTLEDWCDESSVESLEIASKKKKEIQERWGLSVDENSEMTKIAVLNNPAVGEAIRHVSQRSGVPVDKVTEEAIRSLSRMQERTQLPYAWFAATLLQKLFKTLFSGVYISKQDLDKIRDAAKKAKHIVYVPVSKTALDTVLVWYLAIRYQLPIPALILDEALAILGPLSDLLRLAGAVFIKRDISTRTTLNTAVTSAYVQHLMKERGALTLLLDKVRSRTGTFQQPYNDGLIDMVTQEEEDITFIPLNITYEEVPDIALLMTQDLQTKYNQGRHQQQQQQQSLQRTRTTSHRMSTPAKVSRPSDSRAHRVRSRSLGNGYHEENKNRGKLSSLGQKVCHNGKLLVGVGSPIKLQQPQEMQQQLFDRIQMEQKKATVVSVVSLVAAVLLYSRVRGNSIDLNTIKQHLEYLCNFIKNQDVYLLDWQDSEDSETIIMYSIRLLEKNGTLVTLDERHSGFNFRINTESESILQLAYYASQVREIVALDAIFAAVYLSFGLKVKVAELVFEERFEFLASVFQYHFNCSWNIKEEYQRLKQFYSDYLSDAEGILERKVTKTSNSKQYNEFSLLASFVYPVIDSFWVTLCALSSLNDVHALPLSLVPTLSQWIGMHLVSGRRTVYSEVLSTEYNQQSLLSLIQLGLLTKQPAKLVLSPDAQMLMQALGLSTQDELVLQSERDSVVELCKKIESVRRRDEEGALSQYIYEKCQNQIRSLTKASTTEHSFSKRQGVIELQQQEEAMIQLGYALIQSMDYIE